MAPSDLSEKQRNFLVKYLGASVAELTELYGQSGRDDGVVVDDPLNLFLLEEKAARDGDVGVAVRQSVADAQGTTVRLASEALGPLRVERKFFEDNGYKTVFARWVGEIEAALAVADEVFVAVHQSGLSLSQSVKDKSAPQEALSRTAENLSNQAGSAAEAFKAALKKTLEEIAQERGRIDDNLRGYDNDFHKAYNLARGEVNDCLRWDYPEAAALDEELRTVLNTTIQTRTGNAFSIAISQISGIRNKVAQLLKAKEAEYRNKLKPLTDLMLEVQGKIDGHKRLGGLLGTSLNEEQVALTEGKILAARQITEGGRNLQAVDAAVALVGEAKALIDAIDDPAAGKTVKETKDLLSQVEKMINAHKKIRPNDAAETQKALDKLRSSILGLAPQQAKAKADAFSLTILTSSSPGPWTTFQGRAQTQIKWKADYEAKADELETEIRKFDKAFGGTAYSGTMTTDLKTLRGLVATEARETTGDEARGIVSRIEGAIARYKPAIEPDPGNLQAAVAARDALTKDQMEAMRVAQELETAKKAFDQKFETIEFLVNNATTAQPFADLIDADKSSAAEYQQCKEMVKSARTTADKSKDYKTATHLLESAVKDLTKLRKRSTGELFDDLTKMGRVWKIGALGFAGNVANLKAALSKAIDELEEGEAKQARITQVKDISKELEALTAFFQPNAFDDCAAAFDGLKDAKLRKREREEVLRRVRLYRDAIKGNPMMKTIVANPFGVNGVATGLYAQLNKIELMTLRTL